MPKRKTTADLVVHHTERHLAARAPLSTAEQRTESLIDISIFGVAGVFMLLAAFQTVRFSLRAEQSSFIANNATDYATQEAFYTGQTHAVATDPTTAIESVHAAASAVQTSNTVLFFGILLVCAVLLYMYHKHGMLSLNHPHFTVRRIR